METNEICDIVSILKYLYATLQPLANSRNIKLIFSPVVKEIKICYPANKIVSGITKLVSTLIEYMPDDNCIYFTTEIKKEDKSDTNLKYIADQFFCLLFFIYFWSVI